MTEGLRNRGGHANLAKPKMQIAMTAESPERREQAMGCMRLCKSWNITREGEGEGERERRVEDVLKESEVNVGLTACPKISSSKSG